MLNYLIGDKVYAFEGELIHGYITDIIFSRSHPSKCSIETCPEKEISPGDKFIPELFGEIYYNTIDSDPLKAIEKWLKWQIDINSRAIETARKKAAKAIEKLKE